MKISFMIWTRQWSFYRLQFSFSIKTRKWSFNCLYMGISFSWLKLVYKFNLEVLSLWTTKLKIKLIEKEMTYVALLFHAPLFARGLQGK